MSRNRIEAGIQTACSQALELDGWRRVRTDPVSDRATVNVIRKRLAAAGLLSAEVAKIIAQSTRGKGFGEEGMADDLFLRYLYGAGSRADSRCQCGMREGCACGEILWMEWKAPGGIISPTQMTWHHHERARGALTVVGGLDFELGENPVAQFALWYLESGLCRQRRIFLSLIPPEGRPRE